MKRYRIKYLNGDRSKPTYLIQLSKSGRMDGVKIYFLSDGKKYWQAKFKNNLMNGLDKDWWRINPKNNYFTNWKKGKEQGIKIDFR